MPSEVLCVVTECLATPFSEGALGRQTPRLAAWHGVQRSQDRALRGGPSRDIPGHCPPFPDEEKIRKLFAWRVGGVV